MAEHPLKVFILRHFIAIEHPEEPCPEDRHTPEYIQVVSESNAFADWLGRSVAMFGAAFRGPLISGDAGFEDHYLLCLHSPWPEMHGIAFLQTHQAKCEIFVAGDHVYYAQPEALTRFDGQVLHDWYCDEHGAEIPDLDVDLRRRLSRSFHFEMRSLGYTGMTIGELTPRWLTDIYTKRPAEWDWRWFSDVLKQVINNFEREVNEEGHCWFVYEALEQTDGPPLLPPIEDGDLILEVTEALVDEPRESRQWLIRALAIFRHSRVHKPELENIRSLEKNEIFASRRGVFWNGGDGGVMLGEVGSDTLHEHHGEIVEDVEDRLRDHIIESLTSGIEARSSCDDFSRIIEAIDHELEQVDICELWFHDLAPLAERVIERLGSSL